jgi:hypothetical protein
MTVNIKYIDIDFKHLKININDSFSYHDKPLYFQTSYHNLQDFEFPLNNNYCKSISSKLKLKINITPCMDMYKFYKELDDLLDNEEFKIKNFNDTKIKYCPIISKNNEIIYHFPCKKIRNMVPFKFNSNEYFDDENDNILMRLQIISNDIYYDYEYKFKLFQVINETREQINFKSLEELTTFIKKNTNIRFIIKPKLIYDLGLSYYFVQLYPVMVEINKTNNLIIDYDYEYIFEMIQGYRNEIHAIRFLPKNIDELVTDEIITTKHLFLK